MNKHKYSVQKVSVSICERGMYELYEYLMNDMTCLKFEKRFNKSFLINNKLLSLGY